MPLAALDHAERHLGHEEVPRGSNDSQLIRGWLARYGVSRPAPWCAAFVSSMVADGADSLLLSRSFRGSAGALALVVKNPTLLWEHYDGSEPAIGVIDHGGGKGHAFFIASLSDGLCRTVEGNTDPRGSRNGYGVFERHRRLDSIHRVLRIR